MPEHTFNLTPDPKVLIALTRTPLKPLDALCELIDNALDGFRIAAAQDERVVSPFIVIDIPGATEIANGTGVLRVRDNGPGMAPEVAEKALRAGYSSNNPFDSLGLFGMGFNISTGKLGRRTVFTTVREQDAQQLEVRIDLEQIQRSGTYEVPVAFSPRTEQLPHGTVVEVSEWWPPGDMNHNFAKKLAQERRRLRDLIGRRYATILRNRDVRITINGDACEPYEHCVWSSERFVERVGHGQIPAHISFDEVVGSQRRCSSCFTLIDAADTVCSACGSHSFRTVTQSITGWVGVQRFDDETQFGIDLIRNGRTIRVGEKTAFFEFADELGTLTKDYPIDQTYGRLVGEVNLDHVPVDFQKQDFQRSTPEWEQAVTFLRGESSLQPNKPGAATNSSPIFKLFQGYRKVRNFGRRDMYMGQWDTGADRPRRVSREVEKEFYERFKAREPGYYDDSEWWKLVEAADQRPIEELVQCPQCSVENLKSNELCDGCGYALIGHACAGCGERLPSSARTCPECGQDQIPEDTTPWTCDVCGNSNPYDVDACGQCEYPRGTPGLASREFLLGRSQLDDDLSIGACSAPLADGSLSQPVQIKVFRSSEHITPVWNGTQLPILTHRGSALEIFLDLRHEVFKQLDVRPEALIAAEVGHYIYMANQRLVAQSTGQHSVSALASWVMAEHYVSRLDLSPDSLRDSISETLTALRRRIAEGLLPGEAQELFDELDDESQKGFAENLVASGRQLTSIDEVVSSGEFIDFLEPTALVRLFEMRPDTVLTGIASSGTGLISTDLVEGLARYQITELSRSLEDCVAYGSVVSPSAALTRKAKASLEFVRAKSEL